MKLREEILNEFGKFVAQEVFDNQYKFILNRVEDLADLDGKIRILTNNQNGNIVELSALKTN